MQEFLQRAAPAADDDSRAGISNRAPDLPVSQRDLGRGGRDGLAVDHCSVYVHVRMSRKRAGVTLPSRHRAGYS